MRCMKCGSYHVLDYTVEINIKTGKKIGFFARLFKLVKDEDIREENRLFCPKCELDYCID